MFLSSSRILNDINTALLTVLSCQLHQQFFYFETFILFVVAAAVAAQVVVLADVVAVLTSSAAVTEADMVDVQLLLKQLFKRQC